MIKELRLYFRLRPTIKKIKELCKMKLSLNIVIQIIATLLQGYNQIGDLLPAKWKAPAALIIGVIQSIVALLSHFSNPDGTPAALEYVPKSASKLPVIAIISLLGLMAALSGQGMAQSVDRLAFTGGGYFDGAQVKGVAGFIKRLGADSKVYNITETSFGMVPAGTGNIQIAGKDLQADFASGLLYDVYDKSGFSLFGLANAGLQQTAAKSSAMFGAGGGVHRFLYKDVVGLAVFGTWRYAVDPVASSAKWKVNPAMALTFKF